VIKILTELSWRRRLKLYLTVTILAILAAVSLGPTVTPRSYGSPDWPNEPPGFVGITDWSFSALTGSGWDIIFNYDQLASIQSDPTAPFSPQTVGQWQYPTGFIAGAAPATMFYDLLDRGLPQIYFGYWWKPSQPWQDHPAGNKIQFLFTNTSGQFFMIMEPDPHPISAEVEFATSNGHLVPSRGDDPGTRVLTGNRVTVALGAWHRIEVLVKTSTTASSRDGVLRWWVDGVLAGDYTTVNFPADLFKQFQFSPTWGGIGGVKTETDYYWYGPVHLRRPSASARPAAPSGLTVR
jgi:hypothetical protein